MNEELRQACATHVRRVAVTIMQMGAIGMVTGIAVRAFAPNVVPVWFQVLSIASFIISVLVVLVGGLVWWRSSHPAEADALVETVEALRVRPDLPEAEEARWRERARAWEKPEEDWWKIYRFDCAQQAFQAYERQRYVWAPIVIGALAAGVAAYAVVSLSPASALALWRASRPVLRQGAIVMAVIGLLLVYLLPRGSPTRLLGNVLVLAGFIISVIAAIG